VAMSGGTYRHAKIASNTLIALGNRLKGHPCEPLGSDMRIRIPNRVRYFYPDISILCEPPQFDLDDPNKTTILNPKVLIEVLSESSEVYDHGGKFAWYRKNPHVQEYVIISQAEPMIETYLRQSDASWLFNEHKGVSSDVLLQSLELSLALNEIYEGVTFDEAAA
jgi:Uma2 family endonuclease